MLKPVIVLICSGFHGSVSCTKLVPSWSDDFDVIFPTCIAGAKNGRDQERETYYSSQIVVDVDDFGYVKLICLYIPFQWNQL